MKIRSFLVLIAALLGITFLVENSSATSYDYTSPTGWQWNIYGEDGLKQKISHLLNTYQEDKMLFVAKCEGEDKAIPGADDLARQKKYINLADLFSVYCLQKKVHFDLEPIASSQHEIYCGEEVYTCAKSLTMSMSGEITGDKATYTVTCGDLKVTCEQPPNIPDWNWQKDWKWKQ